MSTSVANILLLVVFIVMIYFMMIRPQRKKDKEDREMRASLAVGDEVITIGGIIGKVTKITEKSVVVETGSGKNKIEFLKTAVASVGRESAEEQPKAKPEKEKAVEEKKAPNRDKTVTPKKLGKKEEKVEQPVEAEVKVDEEVK
jgi:preprotein translocase subunit YajC